MSYYRVRLKRVSSTNQAVRTPEVDGYAEDLPVCGKQFVMCGRSLDPNMNVRVVATSLVLELALCRDAEGRERRDLSTESGSRYDVTILGGPFEGDFMDAIGDLPPLQSAGG